MPTQSSVFILILPLLLPITVLFLVLLFYFDISLLSGTIQTPRSQLHDKQKTEGCSFLRPVE